jgi:hypothetical protein
VDRGYERELGQRLEKIREKLRQARGKTTKSQAPSEPE